MNRLGITLEGVGSYLALLGAGALASIFLIVIVNGSWPMFLSPVQSIFRVLGDTFGDAAVVIEGLLFIGPGVVLRAVGTKLQN